MADISAKRRTPDAPAEQPALKRRKVISKEKEKVSKGSNLSGGVRTAALLCPTDPQFLLFLTRLPISILFASGNGVPLRDLVSADPADKALLVFEMLLRERLLSCPVIVRKSGQCVGFVDLGDLVRWLGESVTKAEARNPLEHVRARPDLASKSLEEIFPGGLAARGPVRSFSTDYSLFSLLEAMIREPGLRHVLCTRDGVARQVVTQRQVIEWLVARLPDIGSRREMPIEELAGGMKPIVTVGCHTPAVDAFRVMSERDIAGVAVVDIAGRLIGNLAMRDLKVLGRDVTHFDKLFDSIINFCDLVATDLSGPAQDLPRLPRVVMKYDNLGTVMSIMVRSRVLRVYVEDEEERPVGVITVRDVIRAILT